MKRDFDNGLIYFKWEQNPFHISLKYLEALEKDGWHIPKHIKSFHIDNSLY
jgi:hypothetical protein